LATRFEIGGFGVRQAFSCGNVHNSIV
jgi:hypothetical protein